MASNMVTAWKNTFVVSGAPAIGSQGGNAGDPIKVGGVIGVNLWGTGGTANAIGIQRTGGVGVPVGSTYAVVATDGAFKQTVTTGAAVTPGVPVYITSGNLLTTTSTSNTLYGYADEEAASASTARIAVRIASGIGA